jgi:hypothetical protein
MVQSAEARHGLTFRSSDPSWLYRPPLGRIFVQGVMDTVLIIVTDVITNQPAQLTFIQDDHMVQ